MANSSSHEAAPCGLVERVDKNLVPSTYKYIAAEHHPNYHDFLLAQEAIKKYIQQHGHILYGGTAIDYALRLRGDKIYEDTELPDFDFWSPSNIETAQEIIDILAVLIPGVNIYGTRAKYVRTCRVSVGFNNWVADITYIPRELYEKVPTLTFDGMRIVHPHFQFADLNSSLTFPYDGAPMEVIFARWKKDFERFNKLFNAYPLASVGEDRAAMERSPGDWPSMTQITVPHEIISHSILQGFAAYSLYYNALRTAVPLADISQLPRARPPRMSDENVIIDVPYDLIEIVAHRDVFEQHTSLKPVRKFYPLIDLFEASSMTPLATGNALIVAYAIFGRLAGYQSFPLEAQSESSSSSSCARIRAIGIHGLMKHFIASYLRVKYFSHTINGPIVEASTYRDYYLACLAMIEKSRGTPVQALFDPAIIVYGETTIPLYDMITLVQDVSTILGEKDKIAQLGLPPKNIRPTQSDKPSPQPFNYSACQYMKVSGEEKNM